MYYNLLPSKIIIRLPWLDSGWGRGLWISRRVVVVSRTTVL